MTGETLLAALILAGLANGLVAGLVLLPGRLGEEPGPATGGLLIVGALAGGLILFAGDARAADAPLLHATETALTIAAGPLLLFSVAGLAGYRLPRPIALPGIGGLLAFTFAAIALLPFEAVLPAIIMQMTMTIAAWAVWLRSKRIEDRRTRAFVMQRAALALLVAVTLLHGAQLARMLAPDEPALRWIVPLLLAAIMAIAMTALGARAVRKWHSKSLPPGPEIDEPFRARIDAYLSRHLAEVDLSADRVAQALCLPVVQLRACYAGTGGFAAHLRQMRVAKASEELASPEERNTSIDAIALGCGFRSRSAFYEAFRRQVGCNPGDYRRQMQADLS